MQIKMRKILAMLACLAMLCTLLPLGAMSVSVAAAEEVIYFEDFEDNSTTWHSSSGTYSIISNNSAPVKNPNGGNYVWSAASSASYPYNADRTPITLEPNTEYVLTYDALITSNKWPMQAIIGCNSWLGDEDWDPIKSETTSISNTQWTTLTWTFNSGSHTRVYLGIKSTWANDTTTMYFDNIKLAKAPQASFDGFISNGDFELGNGLHWNFSQTGSVKAEAAHSGSYGAHITNPGGQYGGMFYQNTVNVVAGKTYTVSFWMKVVVGYVNYQVKDGGTGGTNLKSGGSRTTEWTQYSVTVTPTTNILCINMCGGGTGTVDEAYVDDYLVVEEKDPSYDGYIYNGDMETGKTTYWSVHQSTAISTAAKYEGNFGMMLNGSGYNWGGLMNQTINNLKVGKDYTLTFMLKVLTDGVNLQVQNASTNDKLATKYVTPSEAGDWTEFTLTFTADAPTAKFNICGSGNNVPVTAYIDNIVVARVGGEVKPENLVNFAGSSVRDEAASEGATGYGLAFRFTVDATEGQKDFSNKYVERSGKITLDETQFTLVKMGAVMTNNATIGGSSANFTLDAVNGGKIIDIPAVYLCGVTASDVSFAVRILDIPERHIGTEIYARPYFIYEENGEQITVYGDIRSNTYAKAANPKSSIKVLSIGSSFSKDVMETYLYNMFKEGGYEEVTIGYLYMGGCSMTKHLYNVQHNLAQYEYGKNSNGTWVRRNSVSALEALQEEEWDYVTVHPSSDYAGGDTIDHITLGRDSEGETVQITPTNEYESAAPLFQWVHDNATNPLMKLDYHMIWAYDNECDLWSFPYYYSSNQMLMYNKIISNTQNSIMPLDLVNDVIPSGTAIQNGRTSLIGDEFNEPDGYHLNKKYGDYTAALTWYCHFSGDDANVMAGYTGELNDAEFAAIVEAVNNAIRKPFSITESTNK